jgi:phage-related protein
MSNTIREDVVSISFDVGENPFAELTAGMNELRNSITGGVASSTEDLREIARGADEIRDSVRDTTRGTDELRESVQDTTDTAQRADKTFTEMLRSIRDIAKAKIGNGLEKLKSIPQQAREKFNNLRTNIQNLRNIRLSDIGNGLNRALGRGVTAGGKLFNSLKRAAGVGFNTAIKGIKTLAAKAGSAAISIGKIGFKGLVAGATAAAGAVAGLAGAAIKAYADFEQLEGGVKTLFGDDVAATVQKNANNAFKTAGLSANEYMETVTSFSASLISSVGGDTAKAANLADVAIRDMADNANKMGTDMESIQNAYQGFAKGNYDMLDNLKLGYGGTKEEMARLVADAAKVDKSVDANSLSYANVVKAIHAVQDNMGIYGATAAEAEGTISGSLAAMKASWGNMLTAVVQGGDSFDQCVENLVQSVKTFAGNIMPVAKSALSGIVTLVNELAPVIIAEIPSLISELLPQIANAGMQLIQTLMGTLSNNVGVISSTAVQIITSLVQFILTSLPQLITTGMQLLISLVQGIAQQLPTLIPMAINAVITLVNGLIGMLPQLISAGITLLVSLVQGIVQALPQLIPAGIQAILSLIDGIVGAIPQLTQAALELIPVILTAIIENLPQILEGGIKVIVSLVQGLGQAIPQLIEFLPQIASTIIDTLKEIDLLEVGKNIVQGLIEGIGSMIGAVADAAKNVAESAGNAIKNFLGINSPAKLTIGYGQYTGEGLVVGMQDLKSKVGKAAEGLSTTISTNVQPSMQSYTPSSSSVSNTSNSNVTNHFSPQFTLNMNGASATESNKHKVKQWIKESIAETFESMGRTNPELCEV